jgi:predicted double-glycine peptidase
MKSQIYPYSCGSASIVNVLRCYGIKKTEKQIIKLANTNPEIGTTEDDIARVLQSFGFSVSCRDHKSFNVGWNWLLRSLNNSPVILCVKQWSHWIVAIGRLGKKVILFDSGAIDEKSVLVLDMAGMKKLWWNTKMKVCSGISVKD